MQVANILAYYDTAIITAVKSFIVQAPGPDGNKVVLAFVIVPVIKSNTSTKLLLVSETSNLFPPRI
jgi:hypothetical protein